MMCSRFRDKVVIVTGSSSGIGREAALLFAEEGACVVAHGQSEERLKATENALLAIGVKAEKYLIVRGGIEEQATLHDLINKTVEKFGKIDILVNNAGAPNKLSSEDQWSTDNFDFVLSVNLRSVAQLTHMAIPHLEKTKGNVVNVGSVSSMRAMTGYVYYSAAKAGLDQMTKMFALLCGRKGIRVNSVIPGATLTNILSNFGISEEDGHKCFENTHSSLLGRAGRPREVAHVIRFLASDDASYVTGALYAVDGGVSTSPLELT